MTARDDPPDGEETTNERPLATSNSRGVTAQPARTRVVAVTGAASFLGLNLIGLLEEDERVRRIVSDLGLFSTQEEPRVDSVDLQAIVERALNTTAIYGQDSYSIGRLTVIGGVRWERVEGSIPPQAHESSEYFPTGTTILY